MAEHPFMRRAVHAVATGFGLGYAPVASGTFGALLGLPLAVGLTVLHAHLYGQIAICLLLAVLAVPICDAAERMKQLVGDILELSRLKGSDGPLQKIDPRNCIEAVMLRLSDQSLKGAEFSYEALPEVLADSTLLTQVYQNLIVNALKFVPPDCHPEIAFTARKEGRKIVLGVKDNGIGIPAEKRDYIFEPLTRLHSRDEYEGTGIGLAIVKKAIQRMGGKIWIESEPGKGAHFQFELYGA
ncbi:MAG: hypothetical protein KAH44_19830 [Oricola sp.]|nr:hypothetical protein [Oricola sp.]